MQLCTKDILSLKIRIENEDFIFPTLIDSGPDINMLYIDKVPAKLGHPTRHIIHAVGSSSIQHIRIIMLGGDKGKRFHRIIVTCR